MPSAVVVQPGLWRTLSENPESRFSHDAAPVKICRRGFLPQKPLRVTEIELNDDLLNIPVLRSVLIAWNHFRKKGP